VALKVRHEAHGNGDAEVVDFEGVGIDIELVWEDLELGLSEVDEIPDDLSGVCGTSSEYLMNFWARSFWFQGFSML
jgi:hypothetical protein